MNYRLAGHKREGRCLVRCMFLKSMACSVATWPAARWPPTVAVLRPKPICGSAVKKGIGMLSKFLVSDWHKCATFFLCIPSCDLVLDLFLNSEHNSETEAYFC